MLSDRTYPHGGAKAYVRNARGTSNKVIGQDVIYPPSQKTVTVPSCRVPSHSTDLTVAWPPEDVEK